MATFDKRVDAYIAKAEPFAQPVLEHIRELVHKACPEVEETMKWSFPHFEYKGLLCSMASFKKHCAFGFWKGAIMKDPKGILSVVGRTSMGNFDRITSLDDLPSDKVMLDYIKQAAKLNDDDIKLPPKKPIKAAAVKVPDYFMKAITRNKKALATFETFSNSHRKDYVEWITEAKSEETRARRMDQAIEWMSEGKSRNWKYERK
ncbi:MAG TPA: YdeI/OmpD-associated family protein [Chryseosolibacter sp.]